MEKPTFSHWLFCCRTRHIVTALLAVTICLRYIRGLVIPLPIVSLLSIWIVISCLSKSSRIVWSLLMTMVVLGVSLCLHLSPDPCGRIMRFIALTIGMFCFSPLLHGSESFAEYRHNMAIMLFYVLSIFVGASFMIYAYIVANNINIFDSQFSYYGFTGIFNRGMTLSPVAALVAMVAMWKALGIVGNKKHLIYWLSLSCMGMITCVAGGSRIAILGMALGLIVILGARVRLIYQAYKIKMIIPIILGMGGIIILLLPHSLTVVNYKHDIAARHNSLLYSREAKWATRWDEFKSSPILGIGYANAFPEDNNLGETPGAFIPGSSWLTVLTYGGVLAAIPFVWFMGEMVRRLWRMRRREEFPLLLSLMGFFLLNGMTEGWLFFAGSLMFPLFWLTCARIYDFEGNIDV